MAIRITNPSQMPDNTLELKASDLTAPLREERGPRMPAEWEAQSGVQLTWPHAATDWKEYLGEAEEVFVQLAREIAKRERLLIVTPEPERVRERIKGLVNADNVRLAVCDTNDTWARDHGGIALVDKDGPQILDFCFNGWGRKFPAELDNLITAKAMRAGALQGRYVDCLDMVLEGGSVDCDGRGTLLTTACCLLAPNRNDRLNRHDIEEELKRRLHVQRVLWLEHGSLEGDDTDGHIDTLARFCPGRAIAYVQCTDAGDSQYKELRLMEEELKQLRTADGQPYRLVPLPLPDEVRYEGERLPATYANFLVLNGAVLYPTYRQPEKDKLAGEVLKDLFPTRDVVGIDCLPIVRQHGSLHCLTMQYPPKVIE